MPQDTALFWIALSLLPLVWVIASWLTYTRSWWLGGVFGALIGWLIWPAWQGALLAGAIGLLIDFLMSRYLYKILK